MSGRLLPRPFKFLPDDEDWEVLLATVKVKPDKALMKALDDAFKIGVEEPQKRLAMLPKILKLANDFKKSKEVVAAGPQAVKLVQDLINVIPVVRKDLEAVAKELKATGACQIDVQFLISDWNGNSFEFGKGYATFESPGLPKIHQIGELTGSGLNLNNITLRPVGTVSLWVSKGSQSITSKGIPYDFKPGQKLMRFEAVQHFKTHKTKSKTLDDVTNKFSLKGSVGVDFKIVSVGGEVGKESEYKRGYEEEVEWEIEVGMPTFLQFKQV